MYVELFVVFLYYPVGVWGFMVESHFSFIILVVCVFSLFFLSALAGSCSNFIDQFMAPTLFHWFLQCFFFLFHFVFISCYSFFSLLWIYFALLRDSWDVSLDDWSETFPLFSVSSYCHKFLSQCCFDSVPQILICCTFIFLQFNMLFYFPQIRFISCVLFRNVLFKFTVFWRISCYAFANLWFISILVGTRILYDFSVSTLSRFVSRPRMWAVLDVGFPWICENVVYSAVVWSVL